MPGHSSTASSILVIGEAVSFHDRFEPRVDWVPGNAEKLARSLESLATLSRVAESCRSSRAASRDALSGCVPKQQVTGIEPVGCLACCAGPLPFAGAHATT